MEYTIAGAGNVYWVGNMPVGVTKGDKIYSCGCIERDGKIWYRAKHWDTVLHPDELCPFHKEILE